MQAFPDENSSAGLPSGTVTFLFTDIEGSTKLLRQLGDEYITLLADHHQILRSSFTKWHGREVDTEGDAFFVSFPRATDAVNAVVEAQRAFSEHIWPEGVTVLVRMGLHTGEPWTAQEGYVGMDVHRAARIAHVGHGGQVLLSETAAALLKEGLPQGVNLLDLGRHRLKDMAFPEHIRQLVIKGLPSEFPPLKSLEALGLGDVLAEEYVRIPDFLNEEPVAIRNPFFVGRVQELDKLQVVLDETLRGKGGIFFIAGDAGSGKSALLDAFSRSAQDIEPDLLIAQAACSAFTGSGDAYAPFRVVLQQLTGDIEPAWKSGSLDRDGVLRLWSAMPVTVRALVESGPNLIDTLVPSPALQKRVASAMPAGVRLQGQVKKLVEGERSAPGTLEQSNLFEEVRDVLVEVSKDYPLLLLLDDMQWSDSGSINLLFHLARELASSRVLLVCAYRPETIAAGRDGAIHPLEPVLSELKRLHGEIWINLDLIQGRRFVDAFIDCEPNHLGDTFRDRLFAHTGGHALFTVELLRDMQERGDLFKDSDGSWVVGLELNWEKLPAKVEGVIESRISRLEEDLREILSVASVEGEDFTGHVVAQVQQVQDRRLLRQLSQALAQRHRLVLERSPLRLNGRLLSRFRFVHALFQRYLYNSLSLTERQLLHGEVARILQELFADRTQEIAVQLARHFDEAGDVDKALPYLIQAGDSARLLYAFKDANQHYERAVSILKDGLDFDQASRVLMKLGLNYHNAFDYEKASQAYDEGFRLRRRADLRLRTSPLPKVPHAFRINWLPIGTLDPTAAGWWAEKNVIKQLFSGLVTYTPELDIIPDVAHSWKIVDGGRTYIFSLRDDVRWSDGQPVTAHDFIATFHRAIQAVPSIVSMCTARWDEIKGTAAYHSGELDCLDDIGARALDSRTLLVELERPTSYFLQLLAASGQPIPRHVIDKHGDAWSEPGNIVTNGPFMLDSWREGQELVLRRSATYQGGFEGNLHSVTLVQEQDPGFLTNQYANDSLDVLLCWFIQRSEKWIASQDFLSDIRVLSRFATSFASFDVSRPPFDDVRVRRAFVMATDRRALSKATMMGNSLPAAGGMVPPGMPGHSAGIALPYDIENARRLLDKAGYPDGEGFPRIVSLSSRYILSHEPAGISWKSGLNIDMDCRSWFEPEDLAEQFQEERPHIRFINIHASYPDPSDFLTEVIAAGWNNDHCWEDERFEMFIQRARITSDQSERMALFQKAEELLVEEAPVMPLLYLQTPVFVKPWVRNYLSESTALLSEQWKNVILEPH